MDDAVFVTHPDQSVAVIVTYDNGDHRVDERVGRK